jgi:hypothetical protein
MGMQTFTLAVTAVGTIGAAKRRRASLVITNKDASINVARVDASGNVFADGTEIAPGATRFYNRNDDGDEVMDNDIVMVAASGTPNIVIEVNHAENQ